MHIAQYAQLACTVDINTAQPLSGNRYQDFSYLIHPNARALHSSPAPVKGQHIVHSLRHL
eukprot:50931-Pyramimonas_sp.AAC.1